MAMQSINIIALRVERASWPDIPTYEMDEETRRIFEMRKKAVDMYMDGYKKTEIIEATGVFNAVRLVKRCLKADENGIAYGYSALLPYSNINGYSKKKGTNTPGRSFSSLLVQYPKLDELIRGCVKNDRKYVANKNMPVKEIHEAFIAMCVELGIQDSEYPLNTATKAIRSLERYVKYLKQNDMEASVASMDKDARQRNRAAGFMRRFSPLPCMPYSDIHVDGHKLDVVYVVRVDDGDGMWHYDVAMRPWVFTVLAVKPVAVLGYYLTQNEEYDQTDVLKAIQHAILPKKQFPLEEGSVLKYPANGGWPDTAYPCLEYALWDCIMMDNAKAHQAKHVMRKLTNELGMCVSFGPAGTPTQRPNVERSFGTIEREALHRLPYTVGSSPDDARRNEEAAKAAIRDEFTFDKLLAYLDVAYCMYNNSPNRHNYNGVSPIDEVGRLCVNSGMLPLTADEGIIKKVEKLHIKTDVCAVRGSIESGRRPYIQWNRIEYRSEILSKNYCMLTDTNGKPQKVVVEYDPDNIRTMKVFTADKYEYVGDVHATGKWDFDHTEKQHKEMLKMENENNTTGNKFSMPGKAYVEELKANAAKNRRARTKADIASKTMNGNNGDTKNKSNGQKAKKEKAVSEPTAAQLIPFQSRKPLSDEITEIDKRDSLDMARDAASGMDFSQLYDKYFVGD